MPLAQRRANNVGLRQLSQGTNGNVAVVDFEEITQLLACVATSKTIRTEHMHRAEIAPRNGSANALV